MSTNCLYLKIARKIGIHEACDVKVKTLRRCRARLIVRKKSVKDGNLPNCQQITDFL